MKSRLLPLVEAFASFLGRSDRVYKVCKLVVAKHDNDANADMNTNGEAFLLRTLLAGTRRPTLFDVGANVGDYCQLALSLLKDDSTARVFAFEPGQQNLEVLRRRFLDETRLRIVLLALSSESGEKTFYVNTDPSLSGHDSLFDMRTIGYDESTATTRVTCTTLDEFCEAEKISSIDLLKLDVEGHEYGVLQGAREMLQRGAISRIQFEFGHAARAGRILLLDFVTLLTGHGYDLFAIHPRGLRTLTYSPWEENRYSLINILAARRDSAQPLEHIALGPK